MLIKVAPAQAAALAHPAPGPQDMSIGAFDDVALAQYEDEQWRVRDEAVSAAVRVES